MAFKDVGEKSDYKKLTDLKVGESITGYLVGFVASSKYPNQKNLVMNIDGNRTVVLAAGNMKYLIADGKVTAGLLTRITRKEDEKIKGMKASQFKVEQDAEDRMEILQTEASETTSTKSAATSPVADKIAALKRGN